MRQNNHGTRICRGQNRFKVVKTELQGSEGKSAGQASQSCRAVRAELQGRQGRVEGNKVVKSLQC